MFFFYYRKYDTSEICPVDREYFIHCTREHISATVYANKSITRRGDEWYNENSIWMGGYLEEDGLFTKEAIQTLRMIHGDVFCSHLKACYELFAEKEGICYSEDLWG